MIAIVNELLLEGDEFVTGMHLKQLKFTYSSCDTLTGKKKKNKKIKRNRRFKIHLSKRTR